jgi:hypothetical protein
MTTHENQGTTNTPDCLMCAVRQLTEGTPTVWRPEHIGDSITGVVLTKGQTVNNWGSYPHVDLWLGGERRARVVGMKSSVRQGLEAASAQIGDQLTVTYQGNTTENRYMFGDMRETTISNYEVKVTRGHH